MTPVTETYSQIGNVHLASLRCQRRLSARPEPDRGHRQKRHGGGQYDVRQQDGVVGVADGSAADSVGNRLLPPGMLK